MALGAYFYYEGGDGVRFCRGKDKIEQCPHYYGHKREDVEANMPDEIREGLAALGFDPATILLRCHGHYTPGGGHCRGCGAKLRVLGWPVWIEEPDPRPSGKRGLFLGAEPTHRVRPGSRQYLATRKETIAWCVEESRLSKESAHA